MNIQHSVDLSFLVNSLRGMSWHAAWCMVHFLYHLCKTGDDIVGIRLDNPLTHGAYLAGALPRISSISGRIICSLSTLVTK